MSAPRPLIRAGSAALWGQLLGGLLLLTLLACPLPPPAAGSAFAPLLPAALAGPVDWRELPASPEGRQWWDAGSLRAGRNGTLSVLSRFRPGEDSEASPMTLAPPSPVPLRPQGPTPLENATASGSIAAVAIASAAAPDATAAAPAGASDSGTAVDPVPGRPRAATLYVMELDCGVELYRDVSVNGFPRFGAPWRPAAGDSLALATLRAACAAWDARAGAVPAGSDPQSHA